MKLDDCTLLILHDLPLSVFHTPQHFSNLSSILEKQIISATNFSLFVV